MNAAPYIYDAAPVAPDALTVAVWAGAVVAAWVILPRLPWRRLYRWLDSVEVPMPRFVGRVADLVERVRAAVGRVVNPEGEELRAMGRYFASLPPKSGLTRYEEYAAEIEALPPGRERLVARAMLRRSPRPSATAVALARGRAGEPAVDPKIVKLLLQGVKPYCFR